MGAFVRETRTHDMTRPPPVGPEITRAVPAEGPLWDLQVGDAPLAAAAIHDGHAVRAEVAALLAVGEADRLREEDPHTALWTVVAPTRIIAVRSRFELDLNRPRDRAVYLEPAHAWGLEVWKTRPGAEVVARALAAYDAFYQQVELALATLAAWFGRVLLLDLHSYNHRRQGREGPAADAAGHPEINLGTGTMDRRRWAPVVDRFAEELRRFDYLGRHLDVRENVPFQGGQFPRWIHQRFPDSVCAISIEVKKFFMDEWTGRADQAQLHALGEAFRTAAWSAVEQLQFDEEQES